MAGKYALIIGNSEYHDPNLTRLKAPSADVDALSALLRDVQIGGFDQVITLANELSATIRRAIAHFFSQRMSDDLLVLYFSGHGVLDDRGELFLAAKDTERDLVSGTAIPAVYITSEMDRSRSRRQILILDCCHSGAFARGSKGVVGASVGTSTSFEGTGYGRVVLTATDATQYAWEGDQVIGKAENSLFTHYLIEGLRTGEADSDADGQISLDNLYDYVYGQVVKMTPKQTPGKWSYKQQGDIIIARNPKPKLKKVELPIELREAINSPLSGMREGAARELVRYLHGSQSELVLAAYDALKQLAEDDSRRVANAASEAIAEYEARIKPKPELSAGERQASIAPEQLAREKMEQKRIAREQAEIARIAQEKEEQERIAKEKAEVDRIAKAEQERLALEKAKAEQAQRVFGAPTSVPKIDATTQAPSRNSKSHLGLIVVVSTLLVCGICITSVIIFLGTLQPIPVTAPTLAPIAPTQVIRSGATSVLTITPTRVPVALATFTPPATPTPVLTQSVSAATSTTAPPVQPTSIVPSNWRLVLSDKFDSSANWNLITTQPHVDSGGAWDERIGGGVFRIQTKVKRDWFRMYPAQIPFISDSYVTVQARKVSGPKDAVYGLVFREESDTKAFNFQVQSDTQRFFVGLWTDSRWTPLIDWTQTNAIHPNAVNHLTVLAQGPRFTFFINNRLVSQTTNNQIASGQPGVLISLYNAGDEGVFEFSNFEVRAP
ncbi:MAG: caspase family protein [Chloroflexi bacterium]|nr:caspase family protein [Chloroflexota bacterium]